jgi:hypothetical protein
MDDSEDPLDVAASVREELRAQVQRWLQEAAPELATMTDWIVTGAQADTYPLGERDVGVDELVEVLQAQIEVFESHSRLAVAEGGAPAAQLAAAWRAVVYRQVRCVLVLMEAGLGNEALANARTALEHAVLLTVVDEARGAGTLERLLTDVRAAGEDQADSHLHLLDKINTTNGTAYGEVLASTRRLVVDPARPHRRRDRDWDGSPSALFGRLTGVEAAYSLYRQWSNTTHAGAGSAMPYLVHLATRGSISRVPQPLPLAELLATLVWCCSKADSALDGFLVIPSLGAAQAEVLRRIGIGT